jgi:hypothetical protein
VMFHSAFKGRREHKAAPATAPIAEEAA